MRYVVLFASVLALSGCAGQDSALFQGFREGGVRNAVLSTPPAEELPTAPVPDEDARTVAEFDTTTPEDRAAALESAPTTTDSLLGTTVAALGDPGEPGFWMKTPLVTAVTQGRIVYGVSGRSVQVELRPLDGPADGGSQVSLAAMRLLDAPLTGLPELQVFLGV